MIAYLTVYMNRRDATGWLTSAHFRQEKGTYFRQVDLTFASWHELEEGASWDIFGSHDPDDPRSEIVLRNGVVPADQRPQFGLKRGSDVPVTVTVYDWAWRAQRLQGPTTLVVARSLTDGRRAVNDYDRPIGRYTTLVSRNLSGAVRALWGLAGVWTDWRLPDYDLSAMVLDPEQSIWDHTRTLCDPFKAEYYFRRDTNTLVLSDRMATEYGIGTVLTFGEKAVTALEIVASPWKRVRRVIVRLAPWR